MICRYDQQNPKYPESHQNLKKGSFSFCKVLGQSYIAPCRVYQFQGISMQAWHFQSRICNGIVKLSSQYLNSALYDMWSALFSALYLHKLTYSSQHSWQANIIIFIIILWKKKLRHKRISNLPLSWNQWVEEWRCEWRQRGPNTMNPKICCTHCVEIS